MHSDEILKQLIQDRGNGEFCDLHIVCGSQQFHVHKNIVCLQSPVLKAACLGPWKEARSPYEIKECSSDLVELMIDYMYTGGYEEVSAGEANQLSEQGYDQIYATCPVVLHAKMAGLADRYLVEGLRRLSEAKFKQAVHKENHTPALLGVIPDVYALQFGSCKTFRDIIIDSMRERTADPPFGDDIKEKLEGVIAKVPDFASDLLKSYLYHPVLGTCYTCGPGKIVAVEPLQCSMW